MRTQHPCSVWGVETDTRKSSNVLSLSCLVECWIFPGPQALRTCSTRVVSAITLSNSPFVKRRKSKFKHDFHPSVELLVERGNRTFCLLVREILFIWVFALFLEPAVMIITQPELFQQFLVIERLFPVGGILDLRRGEAYGIPQVRALEDRTLEFRTREIRKN